MLSEDLDAWLEHKPATETFYRKRSAWIRRALGDKEWHELKSVDVLGALNKANRWPDQRKKAPDTQRANAGAWQRFQGWAIAAGRLERPIVEKLPKPA